jgi:hypothetical protein
VCPSKHPGLTPLDFFKDMSTRLYLAMPQNLDELEMLVNQLT